MPGGARRLGSHGPSIYLFAAAIGIIGGLVGTTYQFLGRALQHLFVGAGTLLEAARGLPWWQALLIPFGGAVIAGLLAHGLTRRRASQGMADVMEAVTLRKAQQLSIRATVSRALASLALIVTGSSLGREGPIAYMSASFGSRFARLVRVPPAKLGIFAGCGIAAGMAACYLAPLGASIFAMEVVLKSFAVEIFAPIVVSSVFASLVVNQLAAGPLDAFLEGAPLYDLPPFKEGHPTELLIYLLLGCLAALAGWLFVRALRLFERGFQKIPISPRLRLPLGGLLIGVIGIWLPEVWGNGYDAVNEVFEKEALLQIAPAFVMLLFAMKIAATSISLGSGGSGGMFTPTLFVGVSLGLVVGNVAKEFWPSLDPAPFGVVGMAAAIAATVQAPITAIFMLFEMTRETEIVLPLMLAVMSATITARYLGLGGVYMERLQRKGVYVPEGIEETTLTTLHVKDIMREDAVWTRDTASFDIVVSMVQKTRRDSLYVVNAKEELVGVVRLHDIKNFLTEQDLGPAVIAADLTVSVPPLTSDQTLAEILDFFDDPEVHELPVVDGQTHRLLGVVERRDVTTALSVEVLQSGGLRAKFVEHGGAQHYVEMPRGHVLGRIHVPKALVGKRFGDTSFRRETGLTVLTLIRLENGREVRLLPDPTVLLREDDAFVVMGPEEDVKKAGS